jgi:Subtilase family
MPDLITIPGILQFWTRTKGDPRIKIAILDGAADLERACFKGANISQFKPYWSEDIELNDEYYYYLQLATEFNQQQKAKKEADPDHDKDEAKKEREAFFAQFPEQIRQRIELSSHATHIASTILGQHGSPAPGIAPHCTAINIPISFAGDDFISPINLTHAINEALKAGANIIHIAACQPTQTGVSHDLFARAVKQCQDNNILIVAPGGNDKGECWCIPAILPGVLTVGAMRDDGQPFKFSNYGGDYQQKGVMANGENILGAVPGTDEPIREKGTSCAAPIVTAISALLMSMQLQRGEQPNAEAVRQAILNSAIPCDPEEVEEPERCLMGKLNIPGAFQLLTGESLTSIQPSSTIHPEMNFRANSETPLKRTENLIETSSLSGINVN